MGSGYSNMSMVQFPANSWAILYVCGNRGPCVCLPMCLMQWRHLGWFHPLSFNPKFKEVVQAGANGSVDLMGEKTYNNPTGYMLGVVLIP